MKKILLLTTFVLASSCGKIDTTKNSILGSVVAFQPEALTTEDARLLRKICSSLETKETNLGASSSTVYTFAVQDKSCSSDLSGETNVAVNVDYPKFKRVDTGGNFIFPDIEATDSGIMKTICDETDNPISPVKNASGVAIWFSTIDISASDCNSSNGQPCIIIKKGIPSGPSGNKFEIVSQEWMQFQTIINQGNVGFWIFRKAITNTSCTNTDYTEVRATLK